MAGSLLYLVIEGILTKDMHKEIRWLRSRTDYCINHYYATSTRLWNKVGMAMNWSVDDDKVREMVRSKLLRTVRHERDTSDKS